MIDSTANTATTHRAATLGERAVKYQSSSVIAMPATWNIGRIQPTCARTGLAATSAVRCDQLIAETINPSTNEARYSLS